MTTLWYLSIDVETTGDAYHNTLLAVGIYWAPRDPASKEPHVKRRWCFKPLPGDQDDEATMKEFWAKFPAVLGTLRREARPVLDALVEFRDFLRTEAQRRGLGTTKLLTDCPDFDLGRLDYLGQMRTGVFDRPVRYLDTGKRHGVCDPWERLEQLGGGAEEDFERWLAVRAPHAKHTHLPDDDAEHSYWMMIYCDEKRPK